MQDTTMCVDDGIVVFVHEWGICNSWDMCACVTLLFLWATHTKYMGIRVRCDVDSCMAMTLTHTNPGIVQHLRCIAPNCSCVWWDCSKGLTADTLIRQNTQTHFSVQYGYSQWKLVCLLQNKSTHVSIRVPMAHYGGNDDILNNVFPTQRHRNLPYRLCQLCYCMFTLP